MLAFSVELMARNELHIQLWISLLHTDDRQTDVTDALAGFLSDMDRRGHEVHFGMPAPERITPIDGSSAQVLLTDDVHACRYVRHHRLAVFGFGDPDVLQDTVAVFGSYEALSAAYLEMKVCHFTGQPFIIGTWDRYALREFTEADFPSVYRLCREEAFPMFPGLHEGETYEAYRAYVRCQYALYGFGLWAIADHTDSVVGLCGFSAQGEVPDLGYLVRSDLRGRHIAAHAASLALQYAEEELELPCVFLYAGDNNAASLHLAEKLGFVRKRCRQGTWLYVKDFHH